MPSISSAAHAPTLVVERVVWSEAPAEVWNLEVHRAHTYRVGGAGVLVHNDAPDECGKRFSDEKQALVDMAKQDKKAGMTAVDMEAYKDLNKGLEDPFPSQKVRGPESHPLRDPNRS